MKRELTSAEWLAHRRDLVDAYYASGNELKPDPDCKVCDVHNDYVCFDCELNQMELLK